MDSDAYSQGLLVNESAEEQQKYVQDQIHSLDKMFEAQGLSSLKSDMNESDMFE